MFEGIKAMFGKGAASGHEGHSSPQQFDDNGNPIGADGLPVKVVKFGNRDVSSLDDLNSAMTNAKASGYINVSPDSAVPVDSAMGKALYLKAQLQLQGASEPTAQKAAYEAYNIPPPAKPAVVFLKGKAVATDDMGGDTAATAKTTTATKTKAGMSNEAPQTGEAVKAKTVWRGPRA